MNDAVNGLLVFCLVFVVPTVLVAWLVWAEQKEQRELIDRRIEQIVKGGK